MPAQDSAPTITAATQQATSEVHEYLAVSQQRHKLFPRAALVGLCAGMVAVVFRALLAGADRLRSLLIVWSHSAPLVGWVVPVIFAAAGATMSVVLVRRYAPETSGSGIPHLKAVLHRLRELAWLRVLWVKLVGGVLALGSGLALGREGPTVQMGGAIGDAIARRLSVPTRDRLTLTAAGAGAGLAAAFNAPLSGLVFVLEEAQRDFRPAVFGAAFLAAAVADIVTRLVSGQLPVFSIPNYPVPPLAALPAFVVLGLVAGILGVFFNRTLLRTLNLFAQWQLVRSPGFAAVVGAAVGLVAWFSPHAVGGGHDLAEMVLDGRVMLAAIPFWFLLRFGLTMVSYGTGAPGGIFAPLLVLGALIGLGLGQMVHAALPSVVPEPAVFAVVGMAAYFTAIVRAPLTGIVLITEMTGNYGQMLRLLVSCFCAYVIAEYLKDLPIYEALLERDLLQGGIRDDLTEPIVVEHEIDPRAPFVRRTVRSLGLPPGCILVRCIAGGREWIPTAGTRLEPHMRITAVVAPEAAAALAVLREGCEARAH